MYEFIWLFKGEWILFSQIKMKKILIVDDSYYMRAQLKKIVLTDPDFSVIGEAANGLDAINFLKNNQPDIITLDMTMPVMDGIDF